MLKLPVHVAKSSHCSYRADSALLSEYQHVFSVQGKVTQNRRCISSLGLLPSTVASGTAFGYRSMS